MKVIFIAEKVLIAISSELPKCSLIGKRLYKLWFGYHKRGYWTHRY
jgi:hypothetical protein